MSKEKKIKPVDVLKLIPGMEAVLAITDYVPATAKIKKGFTFLSKMTLFEKKLYTLLVSEDRENLVEEALQKAAKKALKKCNPTSVLCYKSGLYSLKPDCPHRAIFDEISLKLQLLKEINAFMFDLIKSRLKLTDKNIYLNGDYIYTDQKIEGWEVPIFDTEDETMESSIRGTFLYPIYERIIKESFDDSGSAPKEDERIIREMTSFEKAINSELNLIPKKIEELKSEMKEITKGENFVKIAEIKKIDLRTQAEDVDEVYGIKDKSTYEAKRFLALKGDLKRISSLYVRLNYWLWTIIKTNSKLEEGEKSRFIRGGFRIVASKEN